MLTTRLHRRVEQMLQGALLNACALQFAGNAEAGGERYFMSGERSHHPGGWRWRNLLGRTLQRSGHHYVVSGLPEHEQDAFLATPASTSTIGAVRLKIATDVWRSALKYGFALHLAGLSNSLFCHHRRRRHAP